MAQLKPQVLRLLRADGFVEWVGADHVHGTLDLALRAITPSE